MIRLAKQYILRTYGHPYQKIVRTPKKKKKKKKKKTKESVNELKV